MKDFVVFDDYVRYPILKGEIELYEEVTYDKFLRAQTKTIVYWKIEDKRWRDHALNYGRVNPAKVKD
jgi:hypothetical protein